MTPTTTLSAINIMLNTIGEAPVASLVGVKNQDVIVAQNILEEIVQELQSEEWHFNTENHYLFTPESDGTITVPSTISRVHPERDVFGVEDVTIRGNRLYDRGNHTYTFDNSFYADIVLCLPFDEMPLEAKVYVTIRAARKFQSVSLGDSEIDKWSKEEEARARAAFVAADARQSNLRLGWKMKIDPVSGNDFR